MASERVIDLSPSEVLAAQLRALGIAEDVAGPCADDRVFDGFVTVMRDAGGLASIADVAKMIGMNPSTVALRCRSMAAMVPPRMLVTKNPRTSRIAYVPVVAP